MGRPAADQYVTEVRLNATGAVSSRRFLAGYRIEWAKKNPAAWTPYYLEITQQAFSAALKRDPDHCITRVVVDAGAVEILKAPTPVSHFVGGHLVVKEEA
jgi:hypothetical protein